MKLQVALATAVAAARKELCQDKKQWADCVVAYAGGECHSTDECDRTCNKCNTQTCFDMIPPDHTYFYDLGISVKSEWPSQQNNGDNSLPIKDADNGIFPFDKANISKFCTDIFENHLCNAVDQLLVYDAGLTYEKSIVLQGKAHEYCRFTCGECLQTDGCYSDHNEAMRYLARDPEASSINADFLSNIDWNFGGDSWGTDDSWGSDNSWDDSSDDSDDSRSAETDAWGGGWGDSWGDDTEDGDDSGGWGDFFSWRKRRDTGTNIVVALKEFLEHIEHPHARAAALTRARRSIERQRRQAILGQSADEFEQRQKMIDQIKVCWVQNDAQGAGESEEEEEEEEEIEEGSEEEQENAIGQILERRDFNDQAGMKNYLAQLTEEASISEACQYEAMPYIEAHMAMTLHYLCKIDCGVGKSATAYNSATGEVHDIDEYKMECQRKFKSKPKEASECTAMTYPNLRVNCEDAQVEEAEEVEEVEEETEVENEPESDSYSFGSDYNLDDYYAMGDFMIGK